MARPSPVEEVRDASQECGQGRRRCRCCRRRAARSASARRRGSGRRRREQRQPAGRAGHLARRTGVTSMPRAGRPRSARATVSRPGPEPTSRVGPAQRPSSASSPGRPCSHWSTGSRSMRPSCVRSRPGRDRPASPRTARRSCRPGRPLGRRRRSAYRAPARDPYGVVGGVDVGQGAERRDPEPAEPPELAGAGVGRDIGTPRSRPGSGSRRPSSQNPPSSAGPKTASLLAAAGRLREHRGGDLGGVHADEHGGAAGVREGVREPLVEPAAALRDHVEAAWQPATGPPVEHEHPPLGRRTRDGVERVFQRRLGDPAAWPGVYGGREPVLTLPGMGSLAMTRNVAFIGGLRARVACRVRPGGCRGPYR